MENNSNPKNTYGNEAMPVNSQALLRRIIVIAILALCFIFSIAYFSWRHGKQKVTAGESSPSLAGKQANKETEDRHDESNQKDALEINAEMAELVGIKTEAAVTGDIDESIATTGRILVDPDQQAVIGAKVDGRAVRILAEQGQQVRANQVLVVVDSPQIAELRGQLIEARARLNLAEQKLASTTQDENRVAVIQTKNRMDLAEATLERKRQLVAMGAVASREVKEAETEYKNAKAEYEFQAGIQIKREQQEAEADVAQAQAVVDRLVHSLSAFGAGEEGKGGEIAISSPIAGTVTTRHISMGETVTPEKELLTVMNLATVIVEAQLPESQATNLTIGRDLLIRIPGAQDRTMAGKIQLIANTVDANKRTVAVRARINNADAILKHEMAVDVQIVFGERKQAILVPVSSLVDDDGIKIVFVKDGNRYERRIVATGTINYRVAEIQNGVKAGEEVVTAGAYQLANMRNNSGEEEEHHDD